MTRVLVVEDEESYSDALAYMLRKEGFEVASFLRGKEGLEHLRRNPPDLVLLDALMPGMDGFQATAAIRQDEKSTGGHIPIIAMTAHAMEGDRERCLAAGMDAYIAKPIQGNELIAMVEDMGSSSPSGKPNTAGDGNTVAIDQEAAR